MADVYGIFYIKITQKNNVIKNAFWMTNILSV